VLIDKGQALRSGVTDVGRENSPPGALGWLPGRVLLLTVGTEKSGTVVEALTQFYIGTLFDFR